MSRNVLGKLMILAVVLFLVGTPPARAQFADCSTGLLQMPTAEMQDDGTFMITNNFLNQHSLPTSGWCYNTFQYGFAVSFWGRIEMGYVCTIFNGAWDPRPDKSWRAEIMRNQDRHFTARVCLLREGDFGLNWMPALVLGVSDPTTGTGDYEYTSLDDVAGSGNGFFNRYFAVMTKHFDTPWGQIGCHVGYQYNRRTDYPINGPCAGINWSPIWLQNHSILDGVNLIAEYDSRTVNLGFIASIWQNRFEAMFELQNFQWVNFGLRYKLRIKRITD
jgi:hypothetical protein